MDKFIDENQFNFNLTYFDLFKNLKRFQNLNNLELTKNKNYYDTLNGNYIFNFKKNETKFYNMKKWNKIILDNEIKFNIIDERFFLLIPLLMLFIIFAACIHIYYIKKKSQRIKNSLSGSSLKEESFDYEDLIV